MFNFENTEIQIHILSSFFKPAEAIQPKFAKFAAQLCTLGKINYFP